MIDMKRALQSIIILLSLLTGMRSFSQDVSDEEIARRVALSCMFEDDWKLARSVFDSAFLSTGSDRSRFARILCDVAQTNDARIAEGMVSRLMSYGTPAQLPFLYSQVTNANHGVWAVKAILAIEGVTSNSVAVLNGYFAIANIDFEYRAEACKSLLYKTCDPNISESMREYGRHAAYDFMMQANHYVRGMDLAYVQADPSYKNSKRRLAVLRSVCQLGVNEYQIAYVTNAINELVAYPESDLPE